MPLLMKKMI